MQCSAVQCSAVQCSAVQRPPRVWLSRLQPRSGLAGYTTLHYLTILDYYTTKLYHCTTLLHYYTTLLYYTALLSYTTALYYWTTLLHYCTTSLLHFPTLNTKQKGKKRERKNIFFPSSLLRQLIQIEANHSNFNRTNLSSKYKNRKYFFFRHILFC